MCAAADGRALRCAVQQARSFPAGAASRHGHRGHPGAATTGPTRPRCWTHDVGGGRTREAVRPAIPRHCTVSRHAILASALTQNVEPVSHTPRSPTRWPTGRAPRHQGVTIVLGGPRSTVPEGPRPELRPGRYGITGFAGSPMVPSRPPRHECRARTSRPSHSADSCTAGSPSSRIDYLGAPPRPDLYDQRYFTYSGADRSGKVQHHQTRGCVLGLRLL